MQNNSETLTFRKSYVVLILRLIILEFTLVLLYFLVRFPKSLILPSFFDISNNQLLNILGVVYFAALSTIELILVFQITLDWANEVYEIREESLVHKRGILRLKQQEYTLRNLGSANIYQGFIGKLLNYGTIILTSPILKNDIVLFNIHNPQRILAASEDNIGQSSVKNANIIPRKF